MSVTHTKYRVPDWNLEGAETYNEPPKITKRPQWIVPVSPLEPSPAGWVTNGSGGGVGSGNWSQKMPQKSSSLVVSIGWFHIVLGKCLFHQRSVSNWSSRVTGPRVIQQFCMVVVAWLATGNSGISTEHLTKSSKYFSWAVSKTIKTP